MNHSENEQIHHPSFVFYVETSSSGDINPIILEPLTRFLTGLNSIYYLIVINIKK